MKLVCTYCIRPPRPPLHHYQRWFRLIVRHHWMFLNAILTLRHFYRDSHLLVWKWTVQLQRSICLCPCLDSRLPPQSFSPGTPRKKPLKPTLSHLLRPHCGSAGEIVDVAMLCFASSVSSVAPSSWSTVLSASFSTLTESGAYIFSRASSASAPSALLSTALTLRHASPSPSLSSSSPGTLMPSHDLHVYTLPPAIASVHTDGCGGVNYPVVFSRYVVYARENLDCFFVKLVNALSPFISEGYSYHSCVVRSRPSGNKLLASDWHYLARNSWECWANLQPSRRLSIRFPIPQLWRYPSALWVDPQCGHLCAEYLRGHRLCPSVVSAPTGQSEPSGTANAARSWQARPIRLQPARGPPSPACQCPLRSLWFGQLTPGGHSPPRRHDYPRGRRVAWSWGKL